MTTERNLLKILPADSRSLKTTRRTRTRNAAGVRAKKGDMMLDRQELEKKKIVRCN